MFLQADRTADRSIAMADSNDSRAVVPVARSTRPVSEALLNEKVKKQSRTRPFSQLPLSPPRRLPILKILSTHMSPLRVNDCSVLGMGLI